MNRTTLIRTATASLLVLSAAVTGSAVAVSTSDHSPAAVQPNHPEGGLELKDIPAKDFASTYNWAPADPMQPWEVTCLNTGPYPDIVSDRDYAEAVASGDPLQLQCAVDRRENR